MLRREKYNRVDLLIMFAIGKLPAWAMAWVNKHLAECSGCREFVDNTIRTIGEFALDGPLPYDELDEPDSEQEEEEQPLPQPPKNRYGPRRSLSRSRPYGWRTVQY